MLYSQKANCWKIADFGTLSSLNVNESVSTQFSQGTLYYWAPELIAEYARYTNKVDIWALGCILFELVCGKRTFGDDWQVREYVIMKLKADVTNSLFPDLVLSHMLAAVDDLLESNASHRPQASTARLI